MSWNKGGDGGAEWVQFICDTSDCNSSITINGTFIECTNHIQAKGWRALKRTGRPWQYFCPTCAPAAKHENAVAKQHEEERERERDRRREQS